MSKTNSLNDAPAKASSVAEVSSRLSFIKELQALINKHSKENDSDTPDFILAQYLNNCLTNFNLTQQQRSDWYSG